VTQFAFLSPAWPDLLDAAKKAELAVHADPRTACFYARRTLELAVSWVYKHDASVKLPYQDKLSALLHEPTFKQATGEAVFNKSRLINSLGNRAVHGVRSVPTDDAFVAVRELFHVCFWLAHTYGRGNRPAAALTFDPALIPAAVTGSAAQQRSADQLLALQTALQLSDEKLSQVLADRSALDDELQKLRAEFTALRSAVAVIPDRHNYSETETRDYFIDLLLREAGWPLDGACDREYEVTGMPRDGGKGYVDYVLWGSDGKPLALVEAKRTRRDPRVGQQQAKLYADCLEQAFGQRPVIFYSNGYEHWLWNDAAHPPRAVQGFFKKAELELLIQRRSSKKSLANASINADIVERYYQTRAIRRIAEAFERDNDRNALLVMATGSGKTRTVIALADLLMRCNWAKRVLFLADRVALVNQAVNAFKRHLPDSSPVNLVTDKDAEGRVFVSTYPTMMGLINETYDGQRRFGSGHFDLIIIDEAHRSVFQKYRSIFEYFDSYLVGLTATPKDEIDRNTYGLFGLENGVPTDAYTLEAAVADQFLVPPLAVSVPLKFQREGITYDQLSEDDKDEWDALEWDESGAVPIRVEASAINRWLFNVDTVDKVLAHLMTHGIKVAGGDRLGKTILFAKNQRHATFIAERFDVNYPEFQGAFGRVITFQTEYAQSLIDAFSQKEKNPHLAISVDMLDTGIDVPEVVNLVFFKLVRSKTKFWQMLGRGTRLCPDLFGPGQHKANFLIFDFCQNLEYFSQNIEVTDATIASSLGTRLFTTRLALVAELDKRGAQGGRINSPPPLYGDPQSERELRRAVCEQLHKEVSAMNPENFVVRPMRRVVERFAQADAWTQLTGESLLELESEIAGLPSTLAPEQEEAKRFDLMILNLQLLRLRPGRTFETRRDQVRTIAALLEEKSAIPMVRDQMALIQEIQTDEWWVYVTLPMLERVRRRLRDLVRLIERQQRKTVYTDFADEIGQANEVAFHGLNTGNDFAKFRAKAQVYLRAHLDHVAIQRLRTNKPMTATDIAELERMLAESGAGTPADIARAKAESNGLGIFVRTLVGMDRESAKSAIAEFIRDRTMTANQIEFINLIVEQLTEHGVMAASRLYESPFTDRSPQGPDAMFGSAGVDEIIAVLDAVRATAIAA
jgi:type I restriction enzyme, R subunit